MGKEKNIKEEQFLKLILKTKSNTKIEVYFLSHETFKFLLIEGRWR